MKLLFFCCFLIFVSFIQAKNYLYLQDEYKASLKAWQDLNSKAYTYVIAHANDWTAARTTIKVRNGQVVSRRYVEKNHFYHPGRAIKAWSETTPETIGTHDDGAFPPVTFDAVYEDCLDNYLTSTLNPAKANNHPNGPEWFAKFDVDENGLMSRCAFYTSLGYWGRVINVDSIKYC